MLNPYTPIADIDRRVLEDAVKVNAIIVLVTRRPELAEQMRSRMAAIGKTYGSPQTKSFTAGTLTVPLVVLE